MVVTEEDAAAVEAAAALLRSTAEHLAAAGARDEALAAFEPAHRWLGIPRAARLRPLGRVWRLGVLLLERDGAVRGVGAVTRAVPPGHPGHMALSTESRREVRAAAYRGPFADGETVDYDAPPVVLTVEGLRTDEGPMFVHSGRVLVRWSVSAGDESARDLAPYLAERVALLLDPPQGAT